MSYRYQFPTGWLMHEGGVQCTHVYDRSITLIPFFFIQFPIIAGVGLIDRYLIGKSRGVVGLPTCFWEPIWQNLALAQSPRVPGTKPAEPN